MLHYCSYSNVASDHLRAAVKNASSVEDANVPQWQWALNQRPRKEMAKSFDFWFSSAFTSYHVLKVGAGRVYGRALVYGSVRAV